MFKKSISFLLLLATLISALSLSGCNLGQYSVTFNVTDKSKAFITIHKHSFGEWTVAKEATCTDNGMNKRVCSCGEIETEETPNLHKSMLAEAESLSKEDSYATLYRCYQKIREHQKKYECDICDNYRYGQLLDNMLYGHWEDAKGNYLSMLYYYEDFYNQTGSGWLGTNLQTSKKTGNNYYYYKDYYMERGNLIIGYEDTVTSQKTDNFIITFHGSYMVLLNKNNATTYTLHLDDSIEKVVKNNARTAYYCLAKKILDFNNPAAIKVNQCYVDDDKNVYVTIQGTNNFGTIINTKYRLYEIEGYYFMYEYSHSYSTNIDLEELNEKLAAFVEKNGY